MTLEFAPFIPWLAIAILAALATGWALGLTPDLMQAGIETFDLNQTESAGRFNVFERDGATVIVEDAHNAAALTAQATALAAFPAQRRIAVYAPAAKRNAEEYQRQGEVLGLLLTKGCDS